MIVWICAIFGTFIANDSGTYGPSILAQRAPTAIVDNIASRAECARVGAFLAGGASAGSYRCMAVRKVRP